MLRRLLVEEEAQDIVEYALLSAIVGIAAILIWQGVVTTVGTSYTAADAAVQANSACTPDPGGGGC